MDATKAISSANLREGVKCDAHVTCRDGKIRIFVADDGEVLHYKGKKYVYTLWDEPHGRGFVMMYSMLKGCFKSSNGSQIKYLLAPNHIQPVLVEAKTWAGRWDWKSLEV